MKIKTAMAEYTGGNIWLFHGRLEDGNYFLTDDNGSTEILDADPENFDESLYWEWQEAHMVKMLEGKERTAFADLLLDWLAKHPEGRNGFTDSEINAYRNYFQLEM